MPKVTLHPLSPLEQLRAPYLLWRLVQLFVGLVGFGLACALVIEAGLGAMSWDVLTLGIQRMTGLSYAFVTVVSSFIVLGLWIPLRESPGVGTIANAIIVGVAADVGLRVLPDAPLGWVQWAYLFSGILCFSFFDALYIGAQLGTGPRDGLMTGLTRFTGYPIGLIRLFIEVSVVLCGWLLGGSVGWGTLVTAVAVGPIIGFFLPYVTVDVLEGETERS